MHAIRSLLRRVPALVVLLLLVGTALAHAQGPTTGFVQLVVNNQPPLPYLDTYFDAKDEPYPNFTALMQAVEIPLSFDPGLGSVSGFLADGRTRFIFSLERRTVEVGDRSFDVPAGAYRVIDQRLYVDYAQLARWLPLKLVWQVDAFELRVTTEYTLPSQQRKERERQRLALERSRGRGYTDAELQREVPWFDPGMFQLDTAALGGKDQPTQGLVTLRGVQRFLKGDLEYAYTQSYAEHDRPRGDLDYVRLNYYDPLHTWQVTLGDTYTTFSPLVANTLSFRGASFYTGGRMLRFGRTTLIGTAPPGSDVDLYRLGVLVDFTRTDAQGFYRFQNVPLSLQNTLFEVRIYTPQGHTLVEYREVSSHEEMLPRGAVASQGGTGYSRELVNRFRVSGGEARYGLLPSLTLGAYIIRLQNYQVNYDLIQEQQNGGLFVLWRLVPWLVLLGEQAHDTASEGQADRWGAFFAFSGATLDLERRSYGGSYAPPARARSTVFSTPDMADAIDQAEVRTRLLSTNLDLRLRSSDFGESRRLDEHQLRVDRRFTPALGMLLTLNRERHTEPGLPEGGQDGQSLLATYRLTPLSRLEGLFQHATVLHDGATTMWRTSWLKNYEFGSPWAYRLSYVRSSVTEDYADGALGYLFRNNFRVNVQADTLGGWTLRVDYSLPFRVSGQGFRTLPPESFARAGLAGTVYVDENGDGTREPGEPPAPGVHLLAPGMSNLVSGQDGRFSGWGLPTDSPVSVDVDLLSTDALYVPAKARQPLAARPGEQVHLDVPLVPAGGLEGVVRGGKPGEISPAYGLKLVLSRPDGTEQARTRVEWDGTFVLESIPPGTYQLHAEPGELARKGLRLEPSRREVVMPAGRDPAWLSGIEFTLAAPR